MKIGFIIMNYGQGGVERMVVNTATSLTHLGAECFMVVARSNGPYLDELGGMVNVHVLSSEGELVELLGSIAPDILVSAKIEDDKRIAETVPLLNEKPKVFFRVGNPIAHRIALRRGSWISRRRSLRRLRDLYRQADGFIAVSKGIANDLVKGLNVPPNKVHVLPNPTVTKALFARAEEVPEHRWFSEGRIPVVCAVGALRSQKDYATLIKAFARVRKTLQCRLVIFGEGRQRKKLLNLAERLGISEDIDLPGWVDNVHRYMSRANAFALSSRWEGSPNALVEATALGVPVVATDCISGPREILADGAYGKLVPVGNVNAYADALLETLEEPLDPAITVQAAKPYGVEESAKRYYSLFYSFIE